MSGHQTGDPEPDRERQLGSVQEGASGGRGLTMATGALEAVRLGLQLPPAVVGAGVVVVEPALEGDEAGGDFSHGTVPRQECHANILSSDIPNTMFCVAGTMCISNWRIIEKHARKGRLVYVAGKMQTRRWKRDGEDSDRFPIAVKQIRTWRERWHANTRVSELVADACAGLAGPSVGLPRCGPSRSHVALPGGVRQGRSGRLELRVHRLDIAVAAEHPDPSRGVALDHQRVAVGGAVVVGRGDLSMT